MFAVLRRCEMLLIGPKRHFTATQQFGRFRTEADIEPD